MSIRAWTSDPTLGARRASISVPSGAPSAIAAFAPTDISGLIQWADFSAVASLWKDAARTSAVTTDGDIILGVTDKSGAGKHLSVAANGPAYKTGIQNSLSVARFDGVNDTLSNAALSADASTTNFVLAIKRSAIGATSRNPICWGPQAQVVTNSANSATAWLFYANQASAVVVIGGTATNWSIIGLRQNSVSSMDTWVGGGAGLNQDPLSVGGMENATSVFLGSTTTPDQFGDFDVAEVLRYDTALSITDVNRVGNYLATKWSATWSTAS